MKFIRYWSLALCAMLSLSSCDDFLTKEPESMLLKDGVYSSVKSARYGLNGVYEQYARLWSAQYTIAGNYSTDESFASGSSDMAIFSNTYAHFTSSSIFPYRMWIQLYNTIVNANTCIIRTSAMKCNVEEEEIERNEVVGEAKFLRAMIYFDMIQFYGEVPLYLTESIELNDDLYMGRSDLDAIMEQIISDAEYAYENMSEVKVAGKANKWSAAMLLAKIYMLKGGYYKDSITNEPRAGFANGNEQLQDKYYEIAMDYLLDVELNSGCKLHPITDVKDKMQYGALFLKSKRENVDDEIIFDLQYNGTKLTSSWGSRSINGGGKYYESEGFYYGFSGSYPTCEFALSFHDDDVRFRWNIGVYSMSNGLPIRKPVGLPWTAAKYRQETYLADQGVVVYRYADLLLMMAEVVNALENDPDREYTTKDGIVSRTAYDYLNEVRLRVQQDPVDDSYLLAVNPAAIVEKPMDEYGWLYNANLVKSASKVYYTPRHVYFNTPDNTHNLSELFFDAVKMERAWELCFERIRWFDLKRWGILIEEAAKSHEISGASLSTEGVEDPIEKNTLGTITFLEDKRCLPTLTEQYLYMPIPDSEIMVNPNLTPQNYKY